MDDYREFNGSSVDPKRQTKSHIHSAFMGPDKSIYVSDLGADMIYVFDVVKDGTKYQFKEKESITVKKGGGLRHIAFHPKENTMYSLQEITVDIVFFIKENNVLKQS